MLKLQILASLAVLMCGQILWWRRRDNIFAYFQAGLFVASALIPIVGTTVLDAAEPEVVTMYARILLIGAPAYLLGLCFGGHFGLRARSPKVTFVSPFDDVPGALARRVRFAAAVAVVALVCAFLLLGYTPLTAGNRLLAKYGVGPYRAGFERGSQLFHLAINLASTVTAVVLALIFIRRRALEVVLVIGLLAGLACTLNRGEALVGPLTFFIAWGVERGWQPWTLLAIACFSFLGATFVNEIVFRAEPAVSTSFAARVAQTAPDIGDHLGFLSGYRLQGSEQVGLRTVRAGYSLTLSKGYWDPADYALRIRTGLSDVGELASGGLRLPAPIWGYVAYGTAGVVAWSFVSGIFVGWGTALLRRLLTQVEVGRYRHQSLNLVLAWVFYSGTFGVVSLFYFPFRSDVLIMVLAVALGMWPVRKSPRSDQAHDDAGAPKAPLPQP